MSLIFQMSFTRSKNCFNTTSFCLLILSTTVLYPLIFLSLLSASSSFFYSSSLSAWRLLTLAFSSSITWSLCASSLSFSFAAVFCSSMRLSRCLMTSFWSSKLAFITSYVSCKRTASGVGVCLALGVGDEFAPGVFDFSFVVEVTTCSAFRSSSVFVSSAASFVYSSSFLMSSICLSMQSIGNLPNFLSTRKKSALSYKRCQADSYKFSLLCRTVQKCNSTLSFPCVVKNVEGLFSNMQIFPVAS